jgi:predicted transcriptional regulator with HTH domain
VAAALAAVLWMGCAGCGYQTGGKGETLPATLHTIAIPAFHNLTTKYKLTGLLPQEIGREFSTRTRFKVVSDPSQADAVLEGAILRYYTAPTVYDPATARSSGVQVIVWLNLTLRERATGKEIFKRVNYDVKDRYEITGDQQSYLDESDAALARLSRSVARQTVSSILEAW